MKIRQGRDIHGQQARLLTELYASDDRAERRRRVHEPSDAGCARDIRLSDGPSRLDDALDLVRHGYLAPERGGRCRVGRASSFADFAGWLTASIASII
jgi:hypothetical protein